ncbi:uncharacterized protein LOC111599079 isoform X2 [Drosophila hydei]|uniref:Uncharacterized protein LOC111599079 isoform X2 n=1 Tax=Drosophila hydei TaxID=7224 RepID=A0A6J2SVZ8_DROHY|nr:uncharacterized protein LOC111599079 isoform X2 [Drosophila hydei]
MHLPIIVLFLFITHLTHGIEAAEWVGLYRDTNHPGKCVIEQYLILKEGVSVKDPNHECRQIICGFNGSTIFQRP